MEAIVFLGLCFVVFLYVMIRGAIDEKKAKQKYEAYLRAQYGQFPEREYSEEDFENITRLFAHNPGEEYLDDITWNDLDMNRIFGLMNHTQSSSGAEYLYAMLRKPCMNKKEIGEREQHISYFQKETEERVRLQMKLHELGKSGKYSIFDYLEYLDTLGECSNKKHIGMLIALLIAIVLIFVETSFGVILLIVVAGVNMVSYLKEKNTIRPYTTSLAYIMRLLTCGNAILEESLQEMPEYKSRLQNAVTSLDFIRKKYRYVVQLNTTSGSLAEIVIEYINMLTHIDVMQFNRMVRMVTVNKDKIYELVEAIGYVDAMISIGAFRASLPHYCEPKLTEGKEVVLHIEEGYHPVLSNPVVNSFSQNRGMLVTGSNASGKSTFLKMIAINAILAQTIHTCAATAYEGGYYKIYSSMALRDDLGAGDSYYIVEIKALKRVMDATENMGENPLLCFIDEVLRGTNTVERIAASTQILESLARQGIYCFAATHDIELTHLLADKYDNYHFEEEVKDGDVLFSYCLKNGRAQSRNAIQLLKVIGFSDEITEHAENRAQRFLRTGQWN